MDATPPSDAAVADHNGADGAAGVDAGQTQDAGVSLDAHVSADAWVEVDAGVLDGASPDAHVIVDPTGGEGSCSTDGVCWDHPRPFGSTVRGFYRQPDGKVWAVGHYGQIAFFDGLRWIAVESGTDISMFAVDGSGPGNIWATGADGLIMHYDGAAWSRVPSGVSSNLRGLWVHSPEVAWAVGDAGRVLRLVSGSWVPQPAPDGVTDNLLSVAGSGPDDVWVVGAYGRILHWDGQTLTEVSEYACTTAQSTTHWHWYGVTSVGDNDVFLAGGSVGGSFRQPILAHAFGGIIDCKEESENGELYSIDALSGTQVWATGGNGLSYQWDGFGWTLRDSGQAKISFWAAALLLDGTALVGGVQGLMGQYRDGGWTWSERAFAPDTQSPATYDRIIDIAGSPQGTLWALAAKGRLLRRGEQGWSLVAEIGSVDDRPATLGIVADDAIWLQGAGSQMWTYVGAGPVQSSSLDGYGGNPKALWVADASDIFAAYDRKVFRYDGSAWTDDNVASDNAINAMDGTSSSDVWAVGDLCEVRHRGASGWSAFGGPVCEGAQNFAALKVVNAAATDDVWVAGSRGAAFHYDGQQWSAHPFGTETFSDIVRLSTGEVYAFTTAGLMIFDGGSWRPAATQIYDMSGDVSLATDGQALYLGGAYADILSFHP